MTENSLVLPDVPMKLAARDAQQMEASRNFLITWFEKRIAEEAASGDELEAAYNSAIKHKWAVKALRNQLNKAAKRVSFYLKAKAAVEAGFTLVPNFPIDLFAIRVTQAHPTPQIESTTSNWWPSVSDEQPKQEPMGKGGYVSPRQTISQWNEPETDSNGKAITRRYTQVEEFREIDFPVTVAHPIVMDATAQAMGMKLFDSIGICQDTQASRRAGRRKGDPLVIGRIYMPRTNGYGDPKAISFLIAWHVDLRAL